MPFAHEIHDLAAESGIPIKIRACDTMGYGVPYPGASMPRSVAGIIYGLRNYGGFEAEELEWHGHNDFYKAVANSGTAWLYGAAGVNCSLLGIGERTGNTPLEAMVMEYAQIRGTLDGMDTTAIRDIADYYAGHRLPHPAEHALRRRELQYDPGRIHADGLLKDEEIYNIFDTAKILRSPPHVGISRNSGAGRHSRLARPPPRPRGIEAGRRRRPSPGTGWTRSMRRAASPI